MSGACVCANVHTFVSAHVDFGLFSLVLQVTYLDYNAVFVVPEQSAFEEWAGQYGLPGDVVKATNVVEIDRLNNLNTTAEYGVNRCVPFSACRSTAARRTMNLNRQMTLLSCWQTGARLHSSCSPLQFEHYEIIVYIRPRWYLTMVVVMLSSAPAPLWLHIPNPDEFPPG